MEKIVSVKELYDIEPVNTFIYDDTIIPGINGREVDVTASYDNMKLGKVFREDALVFKDLYPSDSLIYNMDKYIVSGNVTKRDVSIMYIFNDRDMDKIKNTDNITIFINHSDISIKKINILKDKEIYTYGNNGSYSDEIIVSDNTLINRISNNKSKYCLAKEKNDDVIEVCNQNNMYVVYPVLCNGYYDVKNNLSNGSIFLLNSLDDIDIIVKYISSRGYNVVSLDNLLSE